MLGVVAYDEDDPADDLPARVRGGDRRRRHLRQDARRRLPRRGAARPSPDPFFGGDGPDRTGCLRCGRCMVGCPHRRQEHAGQELPVVRRARGRADHARAHGRRHPAARRARRLRRLRGHDASAPARGSARPHDAAPRAGVVVAAGALGTNRLLQRCRLNGSLPRHLRPARRARAHELGGDPRRHAARAARPTSRAASRSPARSTPTRTRTSRPSSTATPATACRGLFTLLTGDGTRAHAAAASSPARRSRHPRAARAGRSTRAAGRSARSSCSSCSRSTTRSRCAREPGRDGRVRLTHRAGPASARTRPSSRSPTQFAEWLAKRTGGIAQSSIMEAAANIPSTAHILGGAVIGADPSTGVVDARQRVFGYENLLVLRRRGDPGQRRRQPEPHDHRAGRARDEPRRERVACGECQPLPPRSSSPPTTSPSSPTGRGS